MAFLNVQLSLDQGLTWLLTNQLAAIKSQSDQVVASQADQATTLAALATTLGNIMAKLDDIFADVEAEKTTIAGLSTFIQGLKDQIANAGLSAADQAKVDAIFADAEANKQALADALAANIPPAPAAPAS